MYSYCSISFHIKSFLFYLIMSHLICFVLMFACASKVVLFVRVSAICFYFFFLFVLIILFVLNLFMEGCSYLNFTSTNRFISYLLCRVFTYPFINLLYYVLFMSRPKSISRTIMA